MRKLARKHPAVARILWYVDYLLVRGAVALFRLLPLDAASRAGQCIGRVLGPCLVKKSAIMDENLSVAFPGRPPAERRQLIRQIWARVGRLLAEYPHLGTIAADPARIEIEQRGPAYSAGNDARRVFVTAHQSNWEVAILGMARLGIESTTLYSPASNPFLNRLLHESRSALCCELIPRDNSARPLMRAIAAGRSAAMVVDRRVDNGVEIEFFGHDKESTLMPARLALRFGGGITPIQVERLEGARFRVVVHPSIVPQDPQAPVDVQAVDMTKQVHQLFERWIKSSPEDWFCSKRLWPKRIMQSMSDSARAPGKIADVE